MDMRWPTIGCSPASRDDSGSVQGAQNRANRSKLDVSIDTSTPPCAPIAMLYLHVRNGGGFLTSAQRMFAVIADFKPGHSSSAETMDERSQRTVPFARELNRLAIASQAGAAPYRSV